jgi:hypothetical protein
MDARTAWRIDAPRCWWRTFLDLFWRYDVVSSHLMYTIYYVYFHISFFILLFNQRIIVNILSFVSKRILWIKKISCNFEEWHVIP